MGKDRPEVAFIKAQLDTAITRAENQQSAPADNVCSHHSDLMQDRMVELNFDKLLLDMHEDMAAHVIVLHGSQEKLGKKVGMIYEARKADSEKLDRIETAVKKNGGSGVKVGFGKFKVEAKTAVDAVKIIMAAAILLAMVVGAYLVMGNSRTVKEDVKEAVMEIMSGGVGNKVAGVN